LLTLTMHVARYYFRECMSNSITRVPLDNSPIKKI